MYQARRSFLPLLILLQAAFLCCADPSCAKTLVPDAPTGALRVTARDAGTGLPLPGVTVRLDDAAAVTGADGSCRFTGIAAGATGISAAASTLVPQTDLVFVAQGALTDRELLLAPAPGPRSFDLIVAGAGPGGVAAALQAAGMGMRVALVEESDWVGGQMTAAGVTSLDEGSFLPYQRTGIYGDFTNRISRYYRSRQKSTSTAYWSVSSLAFEPSVGQMVLLRMLRDAGNAAGTQPELILRRKVTAVEQSGGAVTGVQLSDGSRLNCAVLIDATETGEVIALSGARYRLGHSLSDAPDLSGKLNAITYTAVIRQYPAPTPEELILRSAPPGYPAALDAYRQWVTLSGAPGVAYYRWPMDFTQPLSFAFWNAYRGMPDSARPGSYDAGALSYQNITRTGVNAVPVDHPVTARYLEDPAFRAQANRAARLRTLQALYYFQHELGRSDWSAADDEGFDTPYNRDVNYDPTLPADYDQAQKNLPVMPYVREGRRLLGLMTLTAYDLERDGVGGRRNFSTALAVPDYRVDLHGASVDADLDCGDRIDDIARGRVDGAYQVPFEAFIPESLDGLLPAEKNLSFSRLASAATRTQPAAMMTGQAAGALAALAVRGGVAPRAVLPIVLQKKLLDSGVLLYPYGYLDVPTYHRYWPHFQLAQLYGLTAPPDPGPPPPQAAPLAINGGAPQTFASRVQLSFSAAGIPGPAISLQLSRDGVNWSAWEEYAAVKSFTLDNTAGAHTIEVRFLDAAGHLSPVYSAAITLVPYGAGSQATRDDLAQLLYNAFGVVDAGGSDLLDRRTLAILVSQALGLDPAGAPASPFFSDVPSGSPGFAQIQLLQQLGVFPPAFGATPLFYPSVPASRGDAVAFVVNALVAQQRMPATWRGLRATSLRPAAGSLVINDGEPATASRAVTLSLKGGGTTGAPVGMQLSFDEATWTPWEPYAVSRALTLPEGSGLKTVSVRYRDAGGDQSAPARASITLAAPTPRFLVTPVVVGQGTLTPDLPQLTGEGGVATFSVAPGPGSQLESVTGCGGTLTGASFSTATLTTPCSVVATFAGATPDGIVVSGGGKTRPDIGDAVAVLRMALGLQLPTASDRFHGDVAPFTAAGLPRGDGKLDTFDVIGILRLIIQTP